MFKTNLRENYCHQSPVLYKHYRFVMYIFHSKCQSQCVCDQQYKALACYIICPFCCTLRISNAVHSAFSITTFSIQTFSITTFSIQTPNIMTFSILTFSKTTFSITTLIMTVNKMHHQHNVIMLNVVMLSVVAPAQYNT